MRNSAGDSQCVTCSSRGEEGPIPLPAETMALWHMYGVNVCEMYGQTEFAGGIIAYELVANAPKDGHTLLIVSSAMSMPS